MKKFVLFLMVVLMGVFPTVSSYAIDEPTFMGFGVDALFSDEKGSSTNSIDKCIIRSSVDTSTNDSDECLYLLKDDKKSASQGGSSHLYCNSKWCANNTLVFAKDDVSRGGFGTTNFSGPVLMRCETGLNDSWEKVGGIDQLPKCGNSAPEKTITVNGKTIHCARKEKRGNQEYCIGIKSGDICVDSGNGKPAEKPKEAEQKKEAKTEPIEENNKSEETCDTNQGYEYNPVSKKCERTEAGKAEEKKEDPKKEEPQKAPAKKKAAPKAKQKSGKDIFRDDCLAEVPIRGALNQDGTTCTLTDETITDIDALNKAIETYNKKFGKADGKCESLTYKGTKMWSTACKAKDGFVGTWLIYMPKITCEETQIFNDDTGKCDTKAAETPAEEAATAQAQEKNTAAAAAPAKTQGTNAESAVSGNAASTAETTNGAHNELIAEFKNEADAIVDIFQTRAPQVYEYQQQREKYGTDTSEIDECKKSCPSKTCRLNTSNNWECLKLNTDEWATEADCKKSCTGKDKICKMDKDNDQKMWKFKCKNLPALNSNQYTEREECTTKCKGKCVYKTHKERGHIFECPQDN